MYKALLVAILLAGCSAPHSILNYPPESSYLVQYYIYRTHADIEKVCGIDKGGCVRLAELTGLPYHIIHMLWNPCIHIHEFDHVVFKYFHTENAGCEQRG